MLSTSFYIFHHLSTCLLFFGKTCVGLDLAEGPDEKCDVEGKEDKRMRDDWRHSLKEMDNCFSLPCLPFKETGDYTALKQAICHSTKPSRMKCIEMQDLRLLPLYKPVPQERTWENKGLQTWWNETHWAMTIQWRPFHTVPTGHPCRHAGPAEREVKRRSKVQKISLQNLKKLMLFVVILF